MYISSACAKDKFVRKRNYYNVLRISHMVQWQYSEVNCQHEQKATNMDDLNKNNKVIYSPELDPKTILIVWICLGHFNTVIFMVWIGKSLEMQLSLTILRMQNNVLQYIAVICLLVRISSFHSKPLKVNNTFCVYMVLFNNTTALYTSIYMPH